MRALGFLWCLPLTMVGLLVAAVGKVRFIGYREGCLEFAALPGGLVMQAFASTGTVGGGGWCGVCCFYAHENPAPRILKHERHHAFQARMLGVAWPLVYLFCGISAAVAGGSFYFDCFLEQDARAAEDD